MQVSDAVSRDMQMAVSNASIAREDEIMAATEEEPQRASKIELAGAAARDLAVRALWGFCPWATAAPPSPSSAPAVASHPGGAGRRTI